MRTDQHSYSHASKTARHINGRRLAKPIRGALLAGVAAAALALVPSGPAAAGCAAGAPVFNVDGSLNYLETMNRNDVSGSVLFRFSDTGSGGGGRYQTNGYNVEADSCVVDVRVDDFTVWVETGSTMTNSTSEAIHIRSTTTGGIVNIDGTVTGLNDAIQAGGGAETVTVNNGGTVNGDIRMGAGSDTVTVNLGATINGDIRMAGDNDTVNWFIGSTINGIIAGGSGTDTLNLNGTGVSGVFNLNAVATMEILNKNDSGTWILANTANFNTVNVNAGTLQLDGTLNISGVTTIAGTLQVRTGGTYNANGVTNISSGHLLVDAGGTYNALAPIVGGAGADTITIEGTLDATGQNINLGGGNDVLNLLSNDASWQFLAQTFDAGANTDTLNVGGTVDETFLGFSFLTNFEHLVKNGPNIWTLNTGGGTATFGTLTVNQGILDLLGNWEFTTNTTTVIGGATLNIGNGAPHRGQRGRRYQHLRHPHRHQQRDLQRRRRPPEQHDRRDDGLRRRPLAGRRGRHPQRQRAADGQYGRLDDHLGHGHGRRSDHGLRDQRHDRQRRHRHRQRGGAGQ